jgi:hypothetical protein
VLEASLGITSRHEATLEFFRRLIEEAEGSADEQLPTIARGGDDDSNDSAGQRNRRGQANRSSSKHAVTGAARRPSSAKTS